MFLSRSRPSVYVSDGGSIKTTHTRSHSEQAWLGPRHSEPGWWEGGGGIHVFMFAELRHLG